MQVQLLLISAPRRSLHPGWSGASLGGREAAPKVPGRGEDVPHVIRRNGQVARVGNYRM